MRELRVEDALLYLDQVKMEFGDRPHIYNEFLDIMKSFKSLVIDTPGVIQRVSALFHGNKRLVLGFNTFLPDGYKIELPMDGSGLAVYREPGRKEAIQITWPGMAEHLAMQQQQQQDKGAAKPAGVPSAAPAAAAGGAKPPASAAAAAPFSRPSPPAHAAAPPPPPSAPVAAPQVEFSHAINYVTTIKKRFASSPEIYRKFLEILHTYQKEQRGLKEVLNEVSTLFADHPDLLKEFAYFLPDHVQGVAKVQLDEAAAKAEERMRLRAAAEKQAASALKIPVKERPRVPAAHVKKMPFGATQARSENEETEIKKGVLNGVVTFDPVRPPRRNELTPAQSARLYGRPKTIPSVPIEPNTSETDLFAKIKLHFDKKDADISKSTTKKTSSYHEFIKLLHLFGMGIFSKDELLQLLRGLFGKGVYTGMKPNQLLNQLEKVMNQRGPSAPNKKKPTTPPVVSEGVAPVTTNYFPYPKDYVFGTFSGESEADKRVINYKVFIEKKQDKRSLENYDGVKWRKNIHEGVLNRVEDEMYEVDIAIERNARTMKVLQPIAEEMTKLKEAEEKAGQPIGRLQYYLKPKALNSIHIGAIARIYGDSGDEVVQHLAENPFAVVPIVFKRMQEKDKEWRSEKTKLMKEWKKEIFLHFRGSLDVKSDMYKLELENNIADDSLREECQGIIAPKQNEVQIIEFHNTSNPEMALYQPYLSFPLPNSVRHDRAYTLLSSRVSSTDTLKQIWSNFVSPWFGIPLEKDDANVPSATYNRGQKVKTTVGDGEIVSAQQNSTRYVVKFSFGLGYVHSSAIIEALSLDGAPSVEDSTQLFSMQEDTQVIFGTKNMYVFLRLYTFLVSVLAKFGDDIMDEDFNILMGLAAKKDSDNKEFEAQCRTSAKASPRLHIFLNIPFLLERCAEAFARLENDDVVITKLSHLSQLQLKDLNLLRTLSLKVTDEAVYRIQKKSNKMFFNYLPFGEELKLGDSVPVTNQMEVEVSPSTEAITASLSDPVADAEEPDAKRQKTDEIAE